MIEDASLDYPTIMLRPPATQSSRCSATRTILRTRFTRWLSPLRRIIRVTRVGVAQPQEAAERVPLVALPPGRVLRTSHRDRNVLSAKPSGPFLGFIALYISET